MSVFDFPAEQAIGEVARVETARVSVRVTSPGRLREARVGRLVAIKGSDANEWVIGMIDEVWRRPVQVTPQLESDTEPVDQEDSPVEENGIQLVLVGTYRARVGEKKDVFTRAILAFPAIDESVFPVEGDALERFMQIISDASVDEGKAALPIGKFTLDSRATAFLDGNKLFQRHAALVGSTGAGKSCAVASILEQAAALPHVNAVVFDLHGEYRTLTYARHFRIAGPADLDNPPGDVIFLPYWLLNYEEMQEIFVDRSEFSAHNQAMIFHDTVAESKRAKLQEDGRTDILNSFTIDSPVPFDLDRVQAAIHAKNVEKVQGSRGEKQGDFYGHFSRFLVRLDIKRSDHRYGFMYRAPAEWMRYEALHDLAHMLLGHGSEPEQRGIKVVDFSEVPSDVLPVIISLVARLVFQIQFWAPDSEAGRIRHPVLLVCDEAHLYLPRLRENANPLERRALESFERIAKEARKYGIGLLVVSQRPADISQTILSQCNNFICLRLSNAEDQGVVRRLMPDSLGGMLDILPTLEVGEAMVVGDAILLPTRVRLYRPKDEPRSATVDFWKCWHQPQGLCDLTGAVENLRRQSRARSS